MKKQDLEYLKKTLEYALNDCPVKDGDHQTHYNTFTNAISLVDDELNLLNIPVVVGQSEQLVCSCELPSSDFQLDDGTICCCRCEKPIAN